MRFNDRYEIVELIGTDPESTTFSAQDLAAGTPVMIHVLSTGTSRALLDWSRRHLGPMRPVLEVSESKGKPFVVTNVISDFHTLREWLERADRAALNRSEGRADAAKQESEEMGEFTRRFNRLGQSSPPASRPEQKSFLDASAPAQGSVSPTTNPEPGEFTRLFHKPKPASKPDPVADTPLATKSIPLSEPPPEGNWVPQVQWANPGPPDRASSEILLEPTSPSVSFTPVLPQGPSDFTQVIGGTRLPIEPAKPDKLTVPAVDTTPPARPTPAPNAALSYLPLFVGFAVLFLIAAAVVFYFALKN